MAVRCWSPGAAGMRCSWARAGAGWIRGWPGGSCMPGSRPCPRHPIPDRTACATPPPPISWRAGLTSGACRSSSGTRRWPAPRSTPTCRSSGCWPPTARRTRGPDRAGRLRLSGVAGEAEHVDYARRCSPCPYQVRAVRQIRASARRLETGNRFPGGTHLTGPRDEHPTAGSYGPQEHPKRPSACGRRTTGKDTGMAPVVTMRQLLESGVHFGHQTRRWNPKMKRFIFTERNGIYIIDLQQSLDFIDRAYEFIKETVAHGGSVLYVGTKKQAQEAIAEQARRVGMPFVNQRWLGGMLTNFA